MGTRAGPFLLRRHNHNFRRVASFVDDTVQHSTPPTVAGPIEDPTAGRLPAVAKIVAIVDMLFGSAMLGMSVYPPSQFDPYGVAFGVFLPLGFGVLLKSNIARILAQITHGLFGAMTVLGAVFTVIGLLGSSGQGQPASGGVMMAMMLFLVAWTLGITTFFVWGFFVLGRNDVRAACRRAEG